MDDQSTKLHHQAIAAALNSKWDEALLLNQQIIDTDANNIDALNRLGRAHFELGNLTESKKIYQHALKQDPYNQIASKFIKRIEAFDKKGIKPSDMKSKTPLHISSDLFIEEPGKTKVVNLMKVAEPQKLSMLDCGVEVQLILKKNGITVTDMDDEYLGVLPDDLSHHMQRLIEGGNKYQSFIKTTKTNSLTILIRELHRSARFKNQPSFLDSVAATTYSSDHINLKDEDAVMEEDLEEDDGNM
jgi:tetratricopeptide (TPR) repeat protein